MQQHFKFYDIIIDMKNELESIWKQYFRQGTLFGYISSKKVADSILSAIKNAKQNEKDPPDFYYVDKNKTCYMFEHFEFDASYRKKHKGSKYKIAELETNKRLDKMSFEELKNSQIDKSKINYIGTYTDTIDCELNKDNWKINFNNLFDKHYKNIDKYKNSLIGQDIIKRNTSVFKAFIIEDTTESGGYISENNGHILIYPYMFDFGIDKMLISDKVDYYIYLNRAAKQIIIIDKEYIFKLIDVQRDFEKTNILFLNNNLVISGLITIPKKLL